ncbi:MAG: Mrp/NBP35 family ATP-binding protein [Elusimicrobiota bacterium]|jgi:ATP-binding protein involved in chromosome partitioning
MISEQDVLNALSKVQEPELHQDLAALHMIRDIAIDGDHVRFTIMLTTPACPLKGRIEEEARQAVLALPGVKDVQIKLDAEVNKDARLVENKVLPAGIKNVIAVASGKGGVGKSTTAVNLAVALQRDGAKVGLLDADIYGPNIPMMMGIAESERPVVTADQRMTPLEGHGVKVISIGFLVDKDKALIWRGPMLNGVIRQFLMSVEWGDLDYLVVDLPPGTGDASLTLVQSVPLTGVVIVTTPQQVALSDVRRSIAMFNEVRVPILGIIENMSGLECPHCRHAIQLFEGHGGEALSREFDIPLVGQIPFDPAVGETGDHGVPVVIAKPESVQAKVFQKAAELVAARISVFQREVL